MCYNILICIYLQKTHIKNFKLQSVIPICAIKKRCNSCKPCKSHLNKTSFSTQTAIQRYQKTAEIAEKVEKPHKCQETEGCSHGQRLLNKSQP